MKVLITGSNGYLGKQMVAHFRNKKITVIPYDLSEGKDLLNESDLKAEMSKAQVVIHLAAYGDVYQAMRDPVGAVISGVGGTASVVKVANMCGVKKIIYASTWEVYGKVHYEPIDEKHPCMPDHPYSIAKYGGELILRSIANKVPWIILRLGSIYGGEMRPHAVIPFFITKALKKERIILHGGGNQQRQFTYIDDINNAFYEAFKSKLTNHAINIVTDETVTIKEIAQIIKKTIPVQIMIGDSREGDATSAFVSSAKAKKILKWKAVATIQTELSRMIKRMREAIQA